MTVCQGTRIAPVLALLVGALLTALAHAAEGVDRDPESRATTESVAPVRPPTLREFLARKAGVLAATLFFPPGFPTMNVTPAPPPPTVSSGGTSPPPPPPVTSGSSGGGVQPPPSPTPPPLPPPPPPTNSSSGSLWNPPPGDGKISPPTNPPPSTPEPMTLVSGIVGFGLLSVYAWRRRRLPA